jgi:hypothetical protein
MGKLRKGLATAALLIGLSGAPSFATLPQEETAKPTTTQSTAQSPESAKTAENETIKAETAAPLEETVQSPAPKFSISMNTTFASRYLADPGFVVGKGPVNQTCITASYGNLYGYVWSDYDLGDRKTHEVDIGIGYSGTLAKLKKGSLNWTLEFSRWEYPSGLLGTHDDVLIGALSYNGPIDIALKATHLIQQGTTKSGTDYKIRLTKTLPLGTRKGFDLSAIVGANAHYTDTFFAPDRKFRTFMPEATLIATKGPLEIDLFARRQFAIDRTMSTENVYGITGGWKW